VAGSVVFCVLFTIGQTLPRFPASIGTPDGYPLLRLAIWEYFNGLGAEPRAGPFLIWGYHFVLKRHALGIVSLEPCIGKIAARKGLKMIRVADLLCRVDVKPRPSASQVLPKTSKWSQFPSGRFIAGDVRFFTLIQCLDRPGR
jgi:hypothetical protein